MSWLKDRIADLDYDGVIVADGLDDAAVGIVERCGQPPIVIYDVEAAAKILVKRDGTTREEAIEFLEFNSIGAWVGPGTPGWLVERFPHWRARK